jgi:hypothetical protein
MTQSQLLQIGRWVSKVLPKIGEISLKQQDHEAILTDLADIKLLFEVFSNYYGIDFPNCVEIKSNRNRTDYRIKFIALFFLCYEPVSIKSIPGQKLSHHLRSYLSKQINTHATLISQYLPRMRFYMDRVKDFQNEIQQLVAIVKLKKGLL